MWPRIAKREGLRRKSPRSSSRISSGRFLYLCGWLRSFLAFFFGTDGRFSRFQFTGAVRPSASWMRGIPGPEHELLARDRGDRLERNLINWETRHDELIRRPIGARLSIHWLFLGQNRQETRHPSPKDSRSARIRGFESASGLFILELDGTFASRRRKRNIVISSCLSGEPFASLEPKCHGSILPPASGSRRRRMRLRPARSAAPDEGSCDDKNARTCLEPGACRQRDFRDRRQRRECGATRPACQPNFASARSIGAEGKHQRSLYRERAGDRGWRQAFQRSSAVPDAMAGAAAAAYARH